MIPLQVRMRGWMRYRDEETADFSGGNLISICGENGAGKSSIFDAITYALYGRHRLGQQATEELISEDEGASWVEFDFEIDGVQWRVHRGRSRSSVSTSGRTQPGATTHCLYRFDAGSETWVPIPATDSPLNLQKALDGILRIPESAFTSSFLLQQGAATQFLDARPAERFKVISSLIGLEAYENLARLANERARYERGRVQDIAKDLKALEDASVEAVEASREAWRTAQDEAVAAQEAFVRAQHRAGDADRFAKRSTELESLRQLVAEADALIANKTQIEDEARAFAELDAVIETLQRLQTELDTGTALRQEADEARGRARKIDLEALTAALADARKAVLDAEERAADAATELVAASTEERRAYEFFLIAGAVIAAREQLTARTDEAAALEAQLGDLDAAKAEAGELAQLVRAVHPLRAYAASLGRQEKLEAAGPAAFLTKLGEEIAAGDAKLTVADTERLTREEAWQAARDEHSAARARLDDLAAQLKQREEAADEAVCSRCGQPVTEAHRKAEIADLKQQIAAARDQVKVRQTAESDATKALSAARTAVQKLQTDHEALRRRHDAVQRDAATLDDLRTETAHRFRDFEAAAPAELYTLVKDEESGIVEKVLAGLEDAPRREKAASERYQGLLGLAGRFTAVQQELVTATAAVTAAEARAGEGLSQVGGAAAAHEGAKSRLDRASNEQQQAAVCLTSARSAAVSAGEAVEIATQQRSGLEALASQKEIEAQGRVSTAQAHNERLPASMRPRAMQDPASLLTDLTQEQAAMAEAPVRLVQLREAEQNRAGWEGERRSKEDEVAGIPPAHRIPVEDAQALLSEAELAGKGAMEAAQEAASELARLEERLAQRREREDQSATAAHRQRLFTKLSRLLGKNGLQGALVTSALDRIKNHANTFLQHLTGGSLVLELHKGSGADELELRAIDTTCMREARSVHALSGSQKFRCAVAIAMGIGQYAGGAMRSIVIDEGFGSLDEVGQIQMVEELKNLAASMDKVIVVSHLDVFRSRDHFPYQLHVEKAETGSRIHLVA